ncbi:MAG: hypothetical protein COB02_15680 [Candidatus Cloacimonadota bacterium]|nr:MAG: hypothetical protein COB02_15680 [Candidatus Cloacimonadota bacterium]
MDDEKKLIKILLKSSLFQTLFERWDQVKLANCYVAGGCVTQTIWNHLLKKPLLHGLNDIDLVYFENGLSKELELKNQNRISYLFNDLKLDVDLQNEASVHTWYGEKFGYDILPYHSTEEGINTWLPSFAVGLKKVEDSFIVYAPFGLFDLFSMIVRSNKKQINEKIYNKMVARLKKDWPEIKVIAWSD